MEEKDKNQTSTSYNESDSDNNDSIKSSINSIFDIINTAFAPLKALIKIHYKLAIKEFRRDKERFIAGTFTLFLAILFFAGVWILLNVLSIFALYDFLHLNIFYSVLIVTGVNLILTIILFLSGISKLKKPMLSETKKLLKETFQELEKK